MFTVAKFFAVTVLGSVAIQSLTKIAIAAIQKPEPASQPR